MITLLLLVAVTMALKDCLYNAATVFVSREKALPAAIFDALGDISNVLTVSIGGISIVRYGFSVETLLLLAAMAAGSVVGAYGGVAVAQFFERRMGLTP